VAKNHERTQANMKSYRAIISVPIEAADDDAAYQQAVEYAHSLLHPDGTSVAGHLESLAECERGQLLAQRAVWLEAKLA
jgi:hypothetical protein